VLQSGEEAHLLNVPVAEDISRATPGDEHYAAALGHRALIRVPTGSGPFPLFILFHGASGSGDTFVEDLSPALRSVAAVVVAPDSAAKTWDALSVEPSTLLDVFIGGGQFAGFGSDVTFVNQLLQESFRRAPIDRRRIVLIGFSDGATYALALGLANGHAIAKVVAFSPGFIYPAPRNGRPEIFLSHGRTDRVLPIDRASRRINGELRGAGYEVTYREFNGGHTIPQDVASEAFAWASSPVPTGGASPSH
jgi:predicted esterase